MEISKIDRNLTDTLELSECKDGYWLYDTTRGMNLSIRAKTSEEAYIEAITYYQRRTQELEDKLKTLDTFIDILINSLPEDSRDLSEIYQILISNFCNLPVEVIQ
jgi:hypothetical protein